MKYFYIREFVAKKNQRLLSLFSHEFTNDIFFIREFVAKKGNSF